MIVKEHFRRQIFDTPCARCSHPHDGPDYMDGQPRCGVWMSEWTLSGAQFWLCICPEWVQPPYRCACGKTSLHPFPAWLGGRRGCSPECAMR